MTTILSWLRAQSSSATLLGALALLVYGVTRAPEWLVDKFGRLLDRAWDDPSGAAAVVSIVGGAIVAQITALAIAWRRDPNASRSSATPSSPKSGYAAVDVLYLVVGLAGVVMAVLSLHGCGASALQQSAVGVTVALRAEEAVTAAVTADVERRMAECPPATSSDSQAVVDAHNACIDGVRASVEDLATALSSLELAIRATGAAIATATEIDAGQPLPAVVLGAIRDVLSLWDQVEALLRAKGVDVPHEIDLVVAALSALVTA